MRIRARVEILGVAVAGTLASVVCLGAGERSRPASFVEALTTDDGLELSLAASGAVGALRVDGFDLATPSLPSGFAFRELPPTARNVAPNGSFEVGHPPTSWSWMNDGNGTWSVDSDTADGLRSLKLMITGARPRRGSMLLSYKFPILPSTVYTLSFRTKTSGLVGNLTAYVVEENASGKSVQRGVNGVLGTTVWTLRDISYMSSGSAVRAYLKIEVYEGYGTAWVDDVQMLDHFYFTAQNTGSSPTEVRFTLDGAGLGVGSKSLRLTELLSGLAVEVSRAGSAVEFSQRLGPGETATYRLTARLLRPPSERPDPARSGAMPTFAAPPLGPIASTEPLALDPSPEKARRGSRRSPILVLSADH